MIHKRGASPLDWSRCIDSATRFTSCLDSVAKHRLKIVYRYPPIVTEIYRFTTHCLLLLLRIAKMFTSMSTTSMSSISAAPRCRNRSGPSQWSWLLTHQAEPGRPPGCPPGLRGSPKGIRSTSYVYTYGCYTGWWFLTCLFS